MPTIDVNLWSSLRRLTDGREVVQVEAATTGEMLNALKQAYPGLTPVIDAGIAVAVNGEIVSSRRTVLAADSEVFLMQPLKGG
ncbi:hypothetical protein BMJ34_06050 [Sinorhizobium medicae]|uniref:MoaD/ThiS family protein n=1 Tax=Sinorhizobium medicae TaxID=110321 RepID=A0ABX4TQ97_9HYPH|nr:MoaD/ThiS family protein [Sinorhizobium medicae]MDX0716388.1 hypothetical protein [Sinorhizobium medicae]MDX0845918.1 hypothetical protein [Sinorhizobium medicae]PLU06560.1 hypothetical protein BMJ33_06165 [Sinorhizobium medicae]PLU06845.1 hypothetical protein BMJ34_06050 [Sinorhizobium medicae]PLU11751.1 hypothetical protein BMJ30_29000 [Sinorhizobium medicae]